MEQTAHKRKSKKRKKSGARIAAAVALLLLALTAALLLGRELEKRTYQLKYPDTIARYTQEFDLDAYLVAAMIHCESGNRPQAVSADGALGLMQVMPSTGEWIAGKLDIADFHEDALLQPDVNIRFGCWYLRFLLDRYDQNRQLAVAAYNAGHGTVDKWKKNSSVSNGGGLVNIPYEETRNYVEKVQRAYEKYTSLYQGAF